MFKVQQDNEKLKLIRLEEKRQAQEYDKQLQAEYAARLGKPLGLVHLRTLLRLMDLLLDEQERLRAETFAKMKEKSSNNQQMYIKVTRRIS